MNVFTKKRYPRGHCLFKKGEVSPYIWIIVEGQVVFWEKIRAFKEDTPLMSKELNSKISKRLELLTLGEGELLAEESLISLTEPLPQTYNLSCQTDCILFEAKRDKLADVLSRYEKMYQAFLERIEHKLVIIGRFSKSINARVSELKDGFDKSWLKPDRMINAQLASTSVPKQQSINSFCRLVHVRLMQKKISKAADLLNSQVDQKVLTSLKEMDIVKILKIESGKKKPLQYNKNGQNSMNTSASYKDKSLLQNSTCFNMIKISSKRNVKVEDCDTRIESANPVSVTPSQKSIILKRLNLEVVGDTLRQKPKISRPPSAPGTPSNKSVQNHRLRSASRSYYAPSTPTSRPTSPAPTTKFQESGEILKNDLNNALFGSTTLFKQPLDSSDGLKRFRALKKQNLSMQDFNPKNNRCWSVNSCKNKFL